MGEDLGPGEPVAALLREAEQALAVASAGRSMCGLSRAGRPVPAVKYHEGRWAAAREVQRMCRRTDLRPAAAAEVVHDAWQTAAQRFSERDASPDWLAYRTGGIDAMDSLRVALGGSAGVPTPQPATVTMEEQL